MPHCLASCESCGAALPMSTPGRGGLRRFCNAKCRARNRYLRLNHRPEKPCGHCGAAIPAGSHANRDYCSRKCKKAVDADVSRSAPTYRFRRYEKKCKACAVDFVARRDAARFCSETCQRHNSWRKELEKKYRATRQAWIRGPSRAVPFNPEDVLARDGWVCQICGVETPRSLRGSRTERNAPEVDHIIPLSKGGEHSEANTQCLCRGCNIRKRDRMPSELVTGAAQ